MWTDHKNLTYKTTEHASDRVLRQRLILEEYGVDIKFIQGGNNTVADTLSRNEINAANVETRIIETVETHLHELFLRDILVPVDYTTLAIYQRDDEELTRNRTDPELSKKYSTETFGRKLLWTKKSDDDNRTRIWIPKSLQEPLLNWYHKNLMHPGGRRLEDSVRCNFTCPGLSTITKRNDK